LQRRNGDSEPKDVESQRHTARDRPFEFRWARVQGLSRREREKRFENEVRVLKFLEARGCNFVPRLLEADEKKLRIITTNCGTRVEHLDEKRAKELFAELEKFGVRHDDPDTRNVTYRNSDGRFCLIDFEFATILPESKQ
jgi:tRNA A-37 threonylcarbamoyl transferase component Bud32